MASTGELLTSSQVSFILDKSIRTVQRMTESGELPCYQQLPGPNGPRLYERKVVERLAAELAERRSA